MRTKHVTLMLLASTALSSSSAYADDALDQFKLRFERAEKENLQLKAEKLERENFAMKAEALEKENAKLRAESKSVTLSVAQAAPTSTAPAKSKPAHVAAASNHEYISGAARALDAALAKIPKNDPRREMMAKAIPTEPVEQVTQPQSRWDGIYAGLNVGYNAGTNSNVTSENWNNQTQGQTGLGGLVQAGSTISQTFTGNASNNQSGFAGGVQLGYNYLKDRVLFGAETDLQGASLRGTSVIYGDAVDSVTSSVTLPPIGPFPGGAVPGTYSGNGVGTNTIQAGVDYIGTVRGRVGYLAKPELLLYGTAGLAYGGAWANYTQKAAYESVGSVATVSVNTAGLQGYDGNGNQQKLLTGWTAGAGAEWMFMPNLSLKGEALYWNLGNMTVNTKALGGDGINKIWGNSVVNYSGIMTRVGLNYHLNMATAPVIAKY
jgi:outer membrane immunogenic protein